MNVRKKIILGCKIWSHFLVLGLICSVLPSFVSHAEPRVQSYGEELVIVIDPGHGGENLGTIQNGFEEKTMTLVTAQAMYDELIQYDDITVYMTRTDDRDLDLEERAEFAKNVNADFLFSLHYNASENHTHFGTEIWIPLNAPYNAYGYQFGHVFMSEMEDMGLFLRGIKTREGDNGDYYGIIRHSVTRGLPAVILEHCHVDEERDIPYCRTEEEWIAFGKRDALAVAKYFGLSSKKLGVDYSQESLALPKANEATVVQSTLRDETKPDVCILELSDVVYETGEVTLNVTATDYDSPLIYYDYSIDGGKNFCAPIAWPGVDLLEEIYPDTFTLSVKIPSGVQPNIILRAYNLADLYLESNSVPFLQSFLYDEDSLINKQKQDESQTVSSLIEKNRHSAGTVTFTPDERVVEEADGEVSFLTFLKLCLIFVIIIFFAVIVSQSISYSRRKKRRRQRMKEPGDNRNHPM